MILGIDTGGTFTDFVLLDEGRLRAHKVLSTPEAPERAILQGLEEMGLAGRRLRIAHGSTVATNAVLEGRGAKTAYVGNAGLEDVLLLGRQNRARLYDLTPPVDRGPLTDLPRFGVSARMDHQGRELSPVDGEELAGLAQKLRESGVEVVAVNLLFSFRDPAHEQAVRAALPDDLFISLSSDVLPEHREYERGMATWLNAYVGPKVADYIGRLAEGVGESRLQIMQSSGGLMDAAVAHQRAVHLLLSGPAGGLRGALEAGRRAGCERLMSFDMGGTSTDVSMLDGDIRLSDAGYITAGEGRLPVPVPMVDLHTIGAGGGSIARLDEGGVLRVGPQSAGADPGPACYGRGGTAATVTDANLILGRIPEAGFGGGLTLDVDAARRAMQPLAEAMNRDIEAAAEGVLAVVEEAMAGALRLISVERGQDPREFVLVSFGGAGGLHVCALAEKLGMNEALVPIHAGVLSALGMTVTAPARELSRSILQPLETLSADELTTAFETLEGQAREALVQDGVAAADIRFEHHLDLRYQGQSHALNLPWQASTSDAAFHQAHRRAYGHALDMPVELVNLRLSARGPAPALPEALPAAAESGQGAREPAGGAPGLSISREALPTTESRPGPLRITDAVGTTWVAAGWQARRDALGNIRLSRLNGAH
ncbi:hydantoinase/oxoprolinase family protein [Natronospira bacteriovora]|uniref:Hydantoinase/oxoprolinase family protein n=1 Tax=Natronospira bacteriovora TaxID=3069753 RepID=A0ABU0W8X5_9GAMM|nr:hydantoinase/oxoprolinase family protein [Natronospira sp. AB-CW4]MDQ2070489.1 hydantoinase/oxoprolinase family protein [Natronospira sp. AB-CW4]